MDIRKEELRFRIWRATPAFIIQVITVISRCPHPVVYLFSMLGIIASKGSMTAIINLRRGCNGNPAWHHGVRGRDWHPDCVGHHLQVLCGLVIYPSTYERALRVRHHLQVWSAHMASTFISTASKAVVGSRSVLSIKHHLISMDTQD